VNKKTKAPKKSTKAGAAKKRTAKEGAAKKRTAKAKRPKESGIGNLEDKRRSPRYPRSKIWSEETRERHRHRRDQAIEDAGLVTDRMIEKGKAPKDGD
jgi:hypothetical protein